MCCVRVSKQPRRAALNNHKLGVADSQGTGNGRRSTDLVHSVNRWIPQAGAPAQSTELPMSGAAHNAVLDRDVLEHLKAIESEGDSNLMARVVRR